MTNIDLQVCFAVLHMQSEASRVAGILAYYLCVYFIDTTCLSIYFCLCACAHQRLPSAASAASRHWGCRRALELGLRCTALLSFRSKNEEVQHMPMYVVCPCQLEGCQHIGGSLAYTVSVVYSIMIYRVSFRSMAPRLLSATLDCATFSYSVLASRRLCITCPSSLSDRTDYMPECRESKTKNKMRESRFHRVALPCAR